MSRSSFSSTAPLYSMAKIKIKGPNSVLSVRRHLEYVVLHLFIHVFKLLRQFSLVRLFSFVVAQIPAFVT
jgi:hypothetical protein